MRGCGRKVGALSGEGQGLAERYADLGDVRLHYVEVGEGPLVVLLHGFPEFHFSWRHQWPALAAAGFRVVAPDMRGYNLSSKPRGVRRYRMEYLTRDVARLIAACGAERAHVVGHDWGGGVAWAFGMQYPSHLDRLAVLNCPHPARFLRALRSPRQLRKSWYMFFFQLPWLPEAWLRAGDFALVRRSLRTDPTRRGAFSEEEIERYVEAMARPGALTGGINYYRAMFRMGPGRLRRDLRRIDAPVLVIWGERDRYLGKELATPEPGGVPRARVERLPGASHWVQADEPERVNRLLVDFLSEGAG
jgi:epoxide hydrolase 4